MSACLLAGTNNDRFHIHYIEFRGFRRNNQLYFMTSMEIVYSPFYFRLLIISYMRQQILINIYAWNSLYSTKILCIKK